MSGGEPAAAVAGRLPGSGLRADLLGALALLAAGVACFWLLPTSLSFLTGLIALALLALSLDLVTGYGGVATLGHAALFGAGAYGAGIASVHGGLADPLLLLVIGAVCGALAGVVSGAVILRAGGLAQLVLSIALAQLAQELANKASAWTGGSDGLSGIRPGLLLGLYRFDLFGRTGFALALVLLVLTVFALRQLMRTPFGLLVRAIRQDAGRVEAMGAPVRATLLRLYAVSGLVAGLGGALAAITTRVVGLDALSFTSSAEALVMLALGGAGTIWGALAGAALFLSFEHVVSAADPFHWLTLVGALLIAVVLFAPRGLAGAVAGLHRRRRAP